MVFFKVIKFIFGIIGIALGMIIIAVLIKSGYSAIQYIKDALHI